MQNPSAYIFPIVLIAVAIFLRIKRSIGFQRFRLANPISRIVVCFIILVILFSFAFLYHPDSVLPDAAGIFVGLTLAYLGVRNAVFETRKDGLYYRTHVWIEIGILVLFFARLAYRFYTTYGALGNLPPEQVASQLRYERDPITGVIISIFCTYYIGYFAFIITKCSQLLKTEKIEQA